MTESEKPEVERASLSRQHGAGLPAHVRVAIIGSGFAGLGMAVGLKKQGITDFAIVERAAAIGGTWRDNTYPGCACDVPSHLYSFSFAPNPDWTRAFSPQPEIRAYLEHCADRFDLRPCIYCNQEMVDASWDEGALLWRITTTRGAMTANMLALGTGVLNTPLIPRIPGLGSFEGKIFHSATWDHDYDLTDKRVAVIGAGASAIQFVPAIRPKVSKLHLFQRTPSWIIPRHDRALTERQRSLFKALPLAQRLWRSATYWGREVFLIGFVYDQRLLQLAGGLAEKHLCDEVSDPVLREKLTPRYKIGCKRILLSDDFYPALRQDNVELVTEGVREVRAHSIVSADDVERPVDAIIFATGFHVTDAPSAWYVHGRGGIKLADAWQGSPRAYKGTTVAGFPNLFVLTGPNTGVGHTSQLVMIESQIAYVLQCIQALDKRSAAALVVKPAVQQAFVGKVDKRMKGTVWTSGCKSWYLDATGRNSTLWPGFTFAFRLKVRRFDAAAYDLIGQRH